RVRQRCMISPKIAAVLRMLDSEQGDAVAALGKARLLLSREGLTFGDLSRALEHGGQPGPAPDPDLDDAIRRYTEAAARAQAAQEARRRAEEAKRQAETEAFWAAEWRKEDRCNAPLRAEVISRYGSERAVKSWTP